MPRSSRARGPGLPRPLRRAASKAGRPPLAHPRAHGVHVRLSDLEFAALKRAITRHEPVANRRPTLAEAARRVVMVWAWDQIGAHVERDQIKHLLGGDADFKRLQLAKSLRRQAQHLKPQRKRKRKKKKR